MDMTHSLETMNAHVELMTHANVAMKVVTNVFLDVCPCKDCDEDLKSKCDIISSEETEECYYEEKCAMRLRLEARDAKSDFFPTPAPVIGKMLAPYLDELDNRHTRAVCW